VEVFEIDSDVDIKYVSVLEFAATLEIELIRGNAGGGEGRTSQGCRVRDSC
jgi:hypothetical protein